MACFSPVHAHRLPDGRVVMVGSSKIYTLELPCGQCIGCRLRRSAVWAMRCMHESSQYSDNCFITLTYNNDNIPLNRSLDYTHFQKFMRRLRKRFKDTKVRFYMCGEYGDNLGRPHFHAILFNLDFPDKRLWKVSPTGHHLYISDMLAELWPFGYSSIGNVTFESAAYVARYCVSKRTGKGAVHWYSYVDLDTGEYITRVPEFNKMSLKPGIGYAWLDQFYSDVYPRDGVLVNGKMTKPPRYYDKVYEKHFPEIFDKVKDKRLLDIKLIMRNNTYKRVEAKKYLTLQRSKSLKRGLY